MDPPAPTLGGYVVEGLIGRGGMGEVWLAVDPVLRRRVALKVMRPAAAADPELRARFLREGRALAALSHPNIVTVLAAAEDEGVALLVMEYLEGATLRDALALRPPLADRLQWVVQVAQALEAIHDAGLVHRDLKPPNVFVTRFGAKVLDLGIARTLGVGAGLTAEDWQTRTGAVLGTPRYMAPEQWRGARADAWSDQFAFGILAYETLALRHPDTTAAGFGGAGDAGGEPAPLATIAPEMPFGLSAIVAKTLRRSPAERFASMREVVAALVALSESAALAVRVESAVDLGRTVVPAQRAARTGRIFAVGLLATVGVGAAILAPVLRSRSTPAGAVSPAAVVTSAEDAASPVLALPPPDASEAGPDPGPAPSTSAARVARTFGNVLRVSVDITDLHPAFDDASALAWKAAVEAPLLRCLNSAPVPPGCLLDVATITLSVGATGKVSRASLMSRGRRTGQIGPFCQLPALDRCATASAQRHALLPTGELPSEPPRLYIYFDR